MAKKRKEITNIGDLSPDRKNANRGTERGLAILEDSLRKYGAGRSIVVDKKGVVIAGNKTLESAVDLGLPVRVVKTNGSELVVVQREDLDLDDGDKARELAYADNRSSQVGLDWDLERILADVNEGVDLSGLWGDEELAELLKGLQEPKEDPGAQVDRAEELREKWQTERGQVWQVGRHRLMCGDSTEMDWSEVDLLLTDPPYGINIVQGLRASVGGSKAVTIGSIRPRQPYPFGGVKNLRGSGGGGKMVDATLYRPVEGDDKPFDPTWLLSVGEHQIIFGGNYFASKMPDSRCWIVWDKNNTGNFADAELAWTSFDRSVKLYEYTWNGLLREGSRQIEGIRRMHPTQKPVGLFSVILEDFSQEGDVVGDPYSGSGTTLVACEQVNRTGLAGEIDPAYVAVTLERMAGMGLEPKLLDGPQYGLRHSQ